MMIAREEYLGRLARIRQAMADEGIDALLVYSWKRGQVRYISGYKPNYIANVAAAVIPQQSDPTLFIRFTFDLERAQAACWFKDVRASGDVASIGRDVSAHVHELGLDRARIGLVGGDGIIDELPYALFQQLQDDLPDVTFVDADKLMVGVRRIKSSGEFSLLKQSAAVADAAIAAGEKLLAPGVSEYALVSAVEAATRTAGAEDNLVVVASRGSSELVGPPEVKVVEAGALVILEVAVQLDGYWTQVARAFAVDEPAGEQRAIYRAVYNAYQAAAGVARPGNTLGDVGRAAYAVLEAAGYADYIEHDAGHSIGLDLPELPRVGLAAEVPVKVGMALVLHPAVRVPDVGGAFIGGTVLVTEEGPVLIHQIPEVLS